MTELMEFAKGALKFCDQGAPIHTHNDCCQVLRFLVEWAEGDEINLAPDWRHQHRYGFSGMGFHKSHRCRICGLESEEME